MDPLDGAFEFLNWLRKRNEVVILSDTFREFVEPLLHKLHYPTVFCHSLKLDDDLRIVDYCLRQKDQKRHAVKALKGLNYHIVAVGDSYNDISMLQEADHGIFFRPTKKIVGEYPDFPVTHEFDALKNELEQLKK
jgi:phosphoserine/homoserine phosphotransferase